MKSLDPRCDGKVRFSRWDLAQRVVERKRRDGFKGGRMIYRCPVCQGYHIGRPAKAKS